MKACLTLTACWRFQARLLWPGLDKPMPGVLTITLSVDSMSCAGSCGCCIVTLTVSSSAPFPSPSSAVVTASLQMKKHCCSKSAFCIFHKNVTFHHVIQFLLKKITLWIRMSESLFITNVYSRFQNNQSHPLTVSGWMLIEKVVLLIEIVRLIY